jgi:hypothetical protein
MAKPAPADAAYYRRYYESAETRVHGRREIARLARGVTGLIEWFGGELHAVLDVGAGAGFWRDWFAAHRKGARYLSTDVSEHACRRYGHERRDIARWRGRARYDLVICHGVLPYLDDAEAERAIDNMAAMCRGFLYLEAVTARDLRERCDPTHTDPTMHGRTAAWYRARLTSHFTALGCGLHYVRGGPLGFYELERAGR